MPWVPVAGSSSAVLHLCYTVKNLDLTFIKVTYLVIGYHSSLWPDPKTFEKSQRRYSWPKAALFVRDIQIESVYIINNNNWYPTPSNAPLPTPAGIAYTVQIILISFHKNYFLHLESAIVRCGQRPRHLRSQRVAIDGIWMLCEYILI